MQLASLSARAGDRRRAWRWSGDELGADLVHKGVHAAVTAAVYDAVR